MDYRHQQNMLNSSHACYHAEVITLGCTEIVSSRGSLQLRFPPFPCFLILRDVGYLPSSKILDEMELAFRLP